jgi:hypothetical protein
MYIIDVIEMSNKNNNGIDKEMVLFINVYII